MNNVEKIPLERLFSSVATRPSYFALKNSHLDKDNNVRTANVLTNLTKKVTPEQPLVDELGPISTSEANNHLALARLRLTALNKKTANRYLVEPAIGSRSKFRSDIRCHSTLGLYTAFVLPFPLLWAQRVDEGSEHNQGQDLELLTDPVERTAPSVAEPPTCLVGKTVLLVEDDRTTRIIIKALLEQHGMLCVEAENGQEALTLFTSICFSLVITDLQMPVMNGVELIKAIRELEATVDYDRGEAAVPIIIITSEKGDLLKNAIQAGANTYLAKPVVAEELEHTLQLLL